MVLAPFAMALAMVANVSATHPAAHMHAKTQINKASQTKTIKVVVNDGDTLDSIATSHQTTYVRLFDANSDIQDPDVISVGQKVRIPAANEQLPDRELPANAAPPAVTQTTATTNQPSAPAPAQTAVVPTVQSAPVAGCGDNSYANFIYMHESGCRTTAMSPNGCYGIGQACPASKIAYCGADYACQNAFFTAYAGKYGGWAGAYAFWVGHGWW